MEVLKMNIKYFSKTNNINQLKKEYKELVKKYHPDNNKDDTLAIMQKINSEYDYIIKNRIFFDTEEQKEKEIKFSNTLKEILNKIINFENIEIEIIGSWIWLNGNTYPIKEQLKELNFKWSNGKKKWYFTEQQFNKKRYKQKSYETLKSIYGYIKIDNEPSLRLT